MTYDGTRAPTKQELREMTDDELLVNLIGLGPRQTWNAKIQEEGRRRRALGGLRQNGSYINIEQPQQTLIQPSQLPIQSVRDLTIIPRNIFKMTNPEINNKHRGFYYNIDPNTIASFLHNRLWKDHTDWCTERAAVEHLLKKKEEYALKGITVLTFIRFVIPTNGSGYGMFHTDKLIHQMAAEEYKELYKNRKPFVGQDQTEFDWSNKVNGIWMIIGYLDGEL